MPVPQAILDRLRDADALLRAEIGPPATLAPDRDEATPLAALGREVLGRLDVRGAEALADGLIAIARAQLEHFPETLFWDFDYMAGALVEQASSVDETSRLTADIVSLQRQYGRHSTICFRYVHDFTYGFDWAKWMRRAPEENATVGPFDRRFIDYLMRRGSELEQLIEQDDEKYPKLPDGTPRNPFGFSREPSDERRLFRALAARDLLPVRTWDLHAEPRWDRPFADLRAEVAQELGAPTR